jgi:uncharacterized small protein (DUF1192 family)
MTTPDDDSPTAKPRHTIGQDLSLLSVEDIAERIASLHGEIERLEAEQHRKAASRSAAENLFRR